jgi:hypothetical protein
MRTIEIILKTYFLKKSYVDDRSISVAVVVGSARPGVGYWIFCLLEPCQLFRKERSLLLKILILITTTCTQQ